MQSNGKFKPFIEVGKHFDYSHIINSATSSTITNSWDLLPDYALNLDGYLDCIDALIAHFATSFA